MGGVNVVAGSCCFHFNFQPLLRSPSPPQSLASLMDVAKRGGPGARHYVPNQSDGRSPFLATASTKLSRRMSTLHNVLTRASRSMTPDAFAHPDDDFAEPSFNRAFSSMVFIVRELHYSCALQTRYENLQGMLAMVQAETDASFVWLFRQIFSSTPTLTLHLMLLLANFAVHSLSADNIAAAAPPSSHPAASSVAGSGSGGGKAEQVAGAASSRSSSHGRLTAEEEAAWNGMVEEAWRMKASSREESLQLLVAPVSVELEPDDCSQCLRTELMYQKALSHDPDNVLLLSNFAQFLFLVLHDHDRAEYYFKRATGADPADAEALNRYATFLWVARKELGAAEEAYLEAISADPSNSYYSACYAHFLWNTGGDDTCYPLDDGVAV